ncbi:MAG: hypothetical protein FJ118_01375 [Deltaproteobacteria bacterium]|nr:hypothetical protein [Deltaproteobacteria bacterium]
MKPARRAESIVRDIERISPYMYEGLYGAFLRNYMDTDRSKWTANLKEHLSDTNQEWAVVAEDIAALLWERFEKRISC